MAIEIGAGINSATQGTSGWQSGGSFNMGGSSGMGSSAMMGIGSIVGIASSIYTASLQNKIAKANAQLTEAAGRYQNSVQQYNAEVSRAQGLAIRTVADFEIERSKYLAERFSSKQQAGYAKAGVKSGGSPLKVMIDSATQFKLDQAIIDYNAKVGVAESGSRATKSALDGSLALSNAKFESSQMRTMGKYQVGQSIASGIGRVGSLLSTTQGYTR